MGRLGFTAHNITTHHPPGGVKSTASSASTVCAARTAFSVLYHQPTSGLATCR